MTNDAPKIQETRVSSERNFTQTVLSAVIAFLQLFLPDTLAKRLPCMILPAAGIPDKRIAELTKTGERTVRRYRQQLTTCETAEDVSGFLSIKKPSRTRSKTWGLEEEIIAEIEKHNCRTRQEAGSVIKEKSSIELSVTAVGKLLKKGGSRNENADPCPPRQT